MSDQEPRYPFVHVETTVDDADVLSSVLFELGATGVEERDQSTFVRGPAEGRVLLVASFEDHAAAEEAIAGLREHDASLEPRIEEVVGDAWRDAWKEYFEPFALTRTITVCPPWREAPRDGGDVLVLEPGRAFGTGLHATTSLVANVIDDAASELGGIALLDAGCGSGILSFVALMRGAARVVAFDIDPEVLDTVRENAERNGLSDRLHVFTGTVEQVSETFPWVLANIESRILDPMAEELVARVAPGGHLVLSGILTAEEEWMRTRFTGLSRRFEVVEARHMSTGGERAYDKDGWVCLHLREASASGLG
jgi:ribosomal protein L11 methyltransferase